MAGRPQSSCGSSPPGGGRPNAGKCERTHQLATRCSFYSTDIVDMFRQAAGYVDCILRGDKPADLPVQAPVKYETVLNLKTAKALGLNLPSPLLLRADEVIE